MLKQAQCVGGEIQVALPCVWIAPRPAPLALDRLLLFPELLSQLLNEAVAVVGRAEAMTAHAIDS